MHFDLYFKDKKLVNVTHASSLLHTIINIMVLFVGKMLIKEDKSIIKY